MLVMKEAGFRISPNSCAEKELSKHGYKTVKCLTEHFCLINVIQLMLFTEIEFLELKEICPIMMVSASLQICGGKLSVLTLAQE